MVWVMVQRVDWEIAGHLGRHTAPGRDC